MLSLTGAGSTPQDTVFINPGSPWQNAWDRVIQWEAYATSC